MKIILDTSVLITLLLATGDSSTKDIIHLVKLNKLKLIISPETLQELKDVIKTERFKKAPGYKPKKISMFIAWYQNFPIKVEINNSYQSSLLRDPTDNMFLQLALSSKAKYLISLDKDLLVLKSIGSTKIVTPKQFIVTEFPQLL